MADSAERFLRQIGARTGSTLCPQRDPKQLQSSCWVRLLLMLLSSRSSSGLHGGGDSWRRQTTSRTVRRPAGGNSGLRLPQKTDAHLQLYQDHYPEGHYAKSKFILQNVHKRKSHAAGVVKGFQGAEIPPGWRKSILQEMAAALAGRLEEFHVAAQPRLQTKATRQVVGGASRQDPPARRISP